MFRTWALCDSDDGGCGSAGHGGDGIRLWCIVEFIINLFMVVASWFSWFLLLAS